jgi:DNA-binding FrmR family transcriptional regulator
MAATPDPPDFSSEFPAEQQQPDTDRQATSASLQDLCAQTFDRLRRLETALQRTEGLVADKPWDVFTLAHKRLERVEETLRGIQRSIDDSTLPEMCVNIERQIVQTRAALQRSGEAVSDESVRRLCESIDARLLRTEETIQHIEQLVSMRSMDRTAPRAEAEDTPLPSLPWMNGLAVTALILVAVAIGVQFSASRAGIREQAAAPARTQPTAPAPPQVVTAPAVPVSTRVAPAVPQPTQLEAPSRQPLPAPLLTANTAPSNPRPSTQVVAARQPFVGTLSITSIPSGASVSINGKAAGVTPLRLPRQRAGSLAVQIAQDGFERWSAAVRVPADQLTQVTAKLRPMAQ